MYTTARNWTLIERRSEGLPTQSLIDFTRWAMENIPWAMIPGNPTLLA